MPITFKLSAYPQFTTYPHLAAPFLSVSEQLLQTLSFNDVAHVEDSSNSTPQSKHSSFENNFKTKNNTGSSGIDI